MAGNEAGVPTIERFWRRVEVTPECWIWTGHTSGGYGRIRVGGERIQAHRFAYADIAGREIPDGFQVDHLCRNQRCVNPDHLEAVTPRENTLRGESPAAQQAQWTECPRGHALSGENLRVRLSGKRECRTCALDAQRIHRAQNRDAINAGKRARYAADPEPVKAAVRARYAATKAGV